MNQADSETTNGTRLAAAQPRLTAAHRADLEAMDPAALAAGPPPDLAATNQAGLEAGCPAALAVAQPDLAATNQAGLEAGCPAALAAGQPDLGTTNPAVPVAMSLAGLGRAGQSRFGAGVAGR